MNHFEVCLVVVKEEAVCSDMKELEEGTDGCQRWSFEEDTWTEEVMFLWIVVSVSEVFCQLFAFG